MAETAPQVELDPEGERLQLEQLKAEFRQKTAEANAARVTALVPGGSTAPVAGDIKIGADSGTSLASVVAADKLTAAAKAIADALRLPSKNRPIVIVEDRAVALSDLVLVDVQSSIAAIDSLLDDVEASLVREASSPPDGGPYESLDGGGGEGGEGGGEAADKGAGEGAAGGSGASGGGAASSAAGPLGLVGDVIGMLRSDYQVQNVGVRVDRLTLLAEVVRLLGAEANVILPTIAMIRDAPILTEARTLIVRRASVARRVDAFENLNVDPVAARIAATQAHLAQLQATHDKLVADGDKKADNLLPSIAAEKAAIAADLANARYQGARAVVDSAKVSLTAFDTLFAAIATALAGGSPPLAQAALRQTNSRHERRRRPVPSLA